MECGNADHAKRCHMAEDSFSGSLAAKE